MNMMDSPKFRRKRTSATGARQAVDTTSPDMTIEDTAKEVARLRAEAADQARAEAEALRIADAAALAKAEEKARRKAEFEERAQAEALRRVKAAREQREADARKAREDAERQEAERQRRLAEEAQRQQDAAEAAQFAKERADEAQRQKAADAARLVEEQRQQAETLRAMKAEQREQAKRAAEERATAALRDAEQKRRAEEADAARKEAARLADEQQRASEAESARLAEQVQLAEQHRADAEARRAAEERRVEEDARRKAKAAAPVLPLTDMIPVARPPEPVTAPTSPPAEQTTADVETAWGALPELTVDKAHLNRNRIITATREDPAHGAFDVLRTRLLQALSENGWRRVAITSPGKDCGKTFTAANLAISLSRQENCRTILMDLDMRRPSMHKVLGVDSPGSLGDMLRGMTSPEQHLRRMGRNPVNAGRNIAFALNDRPEAYASELLQDPRSAETLRAIEQHYDPDVVLFDLPPALFYDDVIAARPLFDGVLLVIGGGLTTESEISEVERRLGDSMPILGMVLNKAEGTDIARYTY